MNCPNCARSLWFVKEVCPFCKAALTPTEESPSAINRLLHGPGVPEESPSDKENLVILVTCESPAEATAIHNRLAAAGIKATLPDEDVMQSMGWDVNTGSCISILVAAGDYEAAQQVLVAMRSEASPEQADLYAHRTDLALPPLMRVLAFALPALPCLGFVFFFFSWDLYRTKGYRRRAKQWGIWFIAGVVFWTMVFLAWLF